jgi:hypothetical protein
MPAPDKPTTANHNHRARVVVLHGRAAAMDVPTTSLPAWEQALRYGLERVGYEHAACVPVATPFYGQFWRPDAYLPMPVFDPGLEAGPEALPDFGRIGEGLLEFADRYLDLSGKALELLLTDTREYFERKDLRDATDAEVEKAIKGPEPEAVLVGFSMGSLVGYHVLAGKPATYRVKSFVSCGSPIGQRDFYRYVVDNSANRRPRFPACLRMWANIWNDDDPATQTQDLAPLFPSDNPRRRVQSAQTRGRPPVPWNLAAAHNPFDYLSSKALGAAVMTALKAAG